MQLISDVYPDFADLKERHFSGLRCVKKTVMIAFSPRSGSTHLCAALHEAGQNWLPNEIFNPRGPAQYEAEKRSVKTFAELIHTIDASDDESFIFKTCWLDAEPISPFLTKLFPNLNVVHLVRRNDAAQAVSGYKAELSGVWHRSWDQQLPPPIPVSHFDIDRVLQIHANYQNENQRWINWFKTQNILPLRLTYESFQDDINIALKQIVSKYNLNLRVDLPINAGMRKLSDELSFRWTTTLQKRLFNMS